MNKPDWKVWLNDKNECKEWLDKYLQTKVLKESEDNSKLHIIRADKNLIFANWILQKHNEEIPKTLKNSFYNWAITIYYYALYHAALSLVNKKEFSSKSHFATLAFIIYNYYHLQKRIEQKEIALVGELLDKKDIEILGFSKNLREKACYGVSEIFEKSLAEQIKTESIDFINKIKFILKNY